MYVGLVPCCGQELGSLGTSKDATHHQVREVNSVNVLRLYSAKSVGFVLSKKCCFKSFKWTQPLFVCAASGVCSLSRSQCLLLVFMVQCMFVNKYDNTC